MRSFLPPVPSRLFAASLQQTDFLFLPFLCLNSDSAKTSEHEHI